MKRTIRNFYVRTGALLGAMIFVCGLALVGHASAAPLGQADTGTITGQVISLDDVPLPNVKLAAYSSEPGTPNRTMLGEYTSDAQGRYSAQVPAGQVWMEFETQDVLGQSFWGYDNKPVDVVAGQTVGDQDFRVAIRVVSQQPTPVAGPPTEVPALPTVVPPVVPGMPTTGAGPNLWLPILGASGFLMLLLGLVQRRRALR